jgi:hypothetical protein
LISIKFCLYSVSLLPIHDYLFKTKSAGKEKLPWKPFFRVTVQTKDGNRAYTRAYWLEDLGLL